MGRHRTKTKQIENCSLTLIRSLLGSCLTVAPTFASGPAKAGYSPALTGEYTLLDVPGGGVTVIWSWNDNHNGQALAGNQAYIDTLSFG